MFSDIHTRAYRARRTTLSVGACLAVLPPVGTDSVVDRGQSATTALEVGGTSIDPPYGTARSAGHRSRPSVFF